VKEEKGTRIEVDEGEILFTPGLEGESGGGRKVEGRKVTEGGNHNQQHRGSKGSGEGSRTTPLTRRTAHKGGHLWSSLVSENEAREGRLNFLGPFP